MIVKYESKDRKNPNEVDRFGFRGAAPFPWK